MMSNENRIKKVYCKKCGDYLATCRMRSETMCPKCRTWTKTEEGSKWRNIKTGSSQEKQKK